jgi:hypothetical protein
VRGARFARLLQPREKRVAARSVKASPRHQLDVRPGSTNNDSNDACSVVVNVYARTRLRVELLSKAPRVDAGDAWEVTIGSEALAGNVVSSRAFARMAAPAHDIAALVAQVKPADVPKKALLKGSESLRFDPARLLAYLEQKNPELASIRDEEVEVVSHEHGPLHFHVKNTGVPGPYHLGVYVEGAYCPAHGGAQAAHDHDQPHGSPHPQGSPVCGPGCGNERFTRLLNVSVPVSNGKKPGTRTKK